MFLQSFKILRGLFTAMVLILNLTVLGLCLLTLFALDLLLFKSLHTPLQRGIHAIYQRWVHFNRVYLTYLTGTHFRTRHQGTLPRHHWTLLTCNHQSWADILILQMVFEGQLPHLKFFMKQSLIWVPIAGLIAKILDYPFIQRHSIQKMKRNPKYKHANQLTVKSACMRLSDQPTTLVNFPEGTRLTAQKLANSAAPYQHLLTPHSRSVGQVLNAWADLKPDWCDVTLAYQHTHPSLWHWLCGNIPTVVIQYSITPFDTQWIGDIEQDRQFRRQFQEQLNTRWHQNDQWLKAILKEKT